LAISRCRGRGKVVLPPHHWIQQGLKNSFSSGFTCLQQAQVGSEGLLSALCSSTSCEKPLTHSLNDFFQDSCPQSSLKEHGKKLRNEPDFFIYSPEHPVILTSYIVFSLLKKVIPFHLIFSGSPPSSHCSVKNDSNLGSLLP
jgi:hypothetical protein